MMPHITPQTTQIMVTGDASYLHLSNICGCWLSSHTAQVKSCVKACEEMPLIELGKPYSRAGVMACKQKRLQVVAELHVALFNLRFVARICVTSTLTCNTSLSLNLS